MRPEMRVLDRTRRRHKRRAVAMKCLLSLAAVFAALVVQAAEPVEIRPGHVRRQEIMRADAIPGSARYLAFPAVLPISADEIWIAYKAGKSHATDVGAGIEIVSHQLSSGITRVIQHLQPVAPKLYQMAEMVRFGDGTVGVYIDVQEAAPDGRHYRTGAESYRWDATARKFVGPAKMPAVDGVTYGYPFDFVTEGQATWQLIMSFGYLPAGRWSVDVVRSDDAGKSWRFARNLTAEFGNIRANESAFVRHGDGYLVATRGYDNRARLHRTDRQFLLLQETDLTGQSRFVASYVGRPRLFVRDGKGYLLGRNWVRPPAASAAREGTPRAMQLCLLRFDLETLQVTACAILDNAAGENVTDGYYAVPVFTERDGQTWLHVITYKGMNQQPPDIIRLDYRWDEVK